LDISGNVRSSDLRIDNGNIHLGQNAGLTSQGANSIAIGYSAGQTSQGQRSIAIGDSAGFSGLGFRSIAIGANSVGTGGNSIAIGVNSVGTGGNSIAIGFGASTSTFGNSVAIGAGAVANGSNQIVLGTASEFYKFTGMGNNYCLRKLTTTVSITSSGTSQKIPFDTLVYGNITNTGIAYTTGGTFTNINGYPVVAQISTSIIFAPNVTGNRQLRIVSEATAYAYNTANACTGAGESTALNTSITLLLAAGQTFHVEGYQTSGGALNVQSISAGPVITGGYPTFISVIVF
jgi:hypothetical protein